MNPISILLATFLQILCASSLALNAPTPNLLLRPQTLTNLSHPFPLTTSPIKNDHITCTRVNTPIGLHPTYCTTAINIICSKLTETYPARLVRDKWIWTELPGCALGYFLPEEMTPIMIPTSAECEVGIFLEMVEKCAYDSRWNAGSINVAELPSPEGEGRPQIARALMYAMAPMALDKNGLTG